MHGGPAYLLFVEGFRRSDNRIILVNGEMDEVARFSADNEVYERPVAVSPDRQTIAIQSETAVYLVSTEASRISVLFEADPEAKKVRMWLDTAWEGPTIHVVFSHVVGSKEEAQVHISDHFFNWDGEPVPGPACPSGGAPSGGTIDGSAWTSPDGRYVAWLDGEPAFVKYVGFARLDDPWPRLVVADAATCAPIFRIRSARTGERAWNAERLATSEGIVVGTHDGYAIVRLRPGPGIIPLPGSGRTGEWDTGPQPAPTGDGRYFGYGWRVYDAIEDRWVGPPLDPADGPYGLGHAAGPFWWGDSHRERWFLQPDYWGEGWVEWLLLPPKIEFPPFSSEIAFRVAGTGDCLHLREEPDTDSDILDCLRDGSRIVFVQREHPDGIERGPHDPARIHPSLTIDGRGEGIRSASLWVYVRTEDGVEGWVSHDYLEHD